MIQTLPFFLKKAVINGYDQTQSRKAAAALHYFLQKSKPPAAPLTILSVHGNTILDKQIASHAPELTEFIRIRHDLQNYLSKPRFDVILFAPPGRKCNASELYENLSYCRMLLKPGGNIWFVLEQTRRCKLLQRFTWKKNMEAVWLTRTGFTQLHRIKTGGKTIFLCGTRPSPTFRKGNSILQKTPCPPSAFSL
jgi:hypothetical protein